MYVDFCGYTNAGGKALNEDAIGIFDTKYSKLCVVADGLGGHSCGEVASQMAVSMLKKEIRGEVTEAELQDIMAKINHAIYTAANRNRMATTLAMVCIQENAAVIGSVGDSRIYHFSSGGITRVTRDYSMAEYEILSGMSEHEDVRDNPLRNRLLRVVGVADGFKSDTGVITYSGKDAFLICSDGFWENVYEGEMLSALDSANNASEWMQNMLNVLKPRLNDDSDNNSAITIIV